MAASSMLRPVPATLAILSLCSLAPAQWPLRPLPVDPAWAAAKNSFLSGITVDHPGGVLIVDQGSSVIFERAYGAEELVNSTPCTASTLFHLDGSRDCAVRLLAVRMARTEELSLQSRVAGLLPALDEAADDLTIGDLVADRARFLSLEDLLHFRRRNERGTISVTGAITALGRTRSFGDEAHRSTNTLVLIAALEAATEQPIEEPLHPHVFQPGGMVSARWVRDVTTAPEHSAINYGRRPRDEDWPVQVARPLAADEGSLWLSARDATGLCRLLLDEKNPWPLTQGLLQIDDRGRLDPSKGECAVYFEDVDRLTVWASNDRGRASRGVAQSIGAKVAGRRLNGVLVVGGGSGEHYGGTNMKSRYAGRWPVGTYEIFEIERPLVLTHGPRGRLFASTTGFDPTPVYFGSRGPVGDVFEGTISRSTRAGHSSIQDPTTGKPLIEWERNTVSIRFRVGATGEPEAVSVSLRTSGRETRALSDLFLVGPAR